MTDGLFNPSMLYEALAQQGLLPSVSRQYPPSGQLGSYAPTTNRLMAADQDIVAHEMVHGVQNNLLINAATKIQNKKWERQEITPQEAKFLEAMQKIYGESFGRVGQQSDKAKQLARSVRERQLKDLYYKDKDPKKGDSYDSYRTSRKELEAWGVESMLNKGTDKEQRTVQHLNPTMAQEFDLLMSLYNQIPETTRQQFSTKRQQDIKENRAADNFRQPEGWENYLFEDLRTDPFRRTIK
jgi:hypothetical protein